MKVELPYALSYLKSLEQVSDGACGFRDLLESLAHAGRYFLGLPPLLGLREKLPLSAQQMRASLHVKSQFSHY